MLRIIALGISFIDIRENDKEGAKLLAVCNTSALLQ